MQTGCAAAETSAICLGGVQKRPWAAFIGASRRTPQHCAAPESSVLDEGQGDKDYHNKNHDTTNPRSPLRRSTAPAMHSCRNRSTLLSLLLPLALAQNLNVYHFPTCAQTCASDVYPTGCLQNDDSCICADISYLNTIAQCIGLSCDAADLTTSADVFITDCAASGVSLAMSEAEFVAAGDGDGGGGAAASSSVAAASSGFVTSTVEAPVAASSLTVGAPVAASSLTVEGATRTSAAPVPTGTGAATGGGGGGFTLDQKIALGCGIGIGLPGTLGTLWTCFFRGRGIIGSS